MIAVGLGVEWGRWEGSGFLSVAVMKHFNEKQLREGQDLSALQFQVIIKGTQGRNSRGILKQKPWRDGACWLTTGRLMLFYTV